MNWTNICMANSQISIGALCTHAHTETEGLTIKMKEGVNHSLSPSVSYCYSFSDFSHRRGYPLSTLLSLRYKDILSTHISLPVFLLLLVSVLMAPWKQELSGLAPFSRQPTQSLPNHRFVLLCLLCVQTARRKCAWAGIEKRGWAERSVGGGV